MNLLLIILYFYLFLPNSVVSKKRESESKIARDEYDGTSEPATLTTQTNEEEMKHPLLMKMVIIATNKNGCNCNCSNNVQSNSSDTKRKALGFKVVMRNKPEKYAGANDTIRRICPYFVPNEGFKMYKMAAVYWPKFHNLKENLNCFKIDVRRLSEAERKENDFKYGNFNGKVDWTQCHFEIKPPELFSRRRHFLFGGIHDKGVMRNILITYKSNGGFTLEEEARDQWLMLRDLVILRDCMTGEVVVFTKSPKYTTSDNVVQALQDLGEEMIGKTLCEDGDDWLE